MIKIITRKEIPATPKLVAYRITCKEYESVFECQPSDCHYEIVGHGCGGNAINCPVCGNHIQQMYSIGAKAWKNIFQ